MQLKCLAEPTRQGAKKNALRIGRYGRPRINTIQDRRDTICTKCVAGTSDDIDPSSGETGECRREVDIDLSGLEH